MKKEKKAESNRIHIIGAGGVGFWLTLGLARSGMSNITVYDDDNLEGGLGHMRLPAASGSTLKVDLLRGFLRVNFPGTQPEFVKKRFTGSEVVDGDLVVDCSDMAGTARKRIWNKARKGGARCIRVSYDGAQSVVAVSEGLPLTNNQAASGYASVPSLALSLAAGGIGAEVIAKTDWSKVQHVEFQVSVAELVSGPIGEVLELAA